MVAVIGGISVFLEDDSARFQQSMSRNAAQVEQQTARMTRSLGNTAKSVDDLNRRAAGFQPDAFRALAISALRAESSMQRLRASMLAVTALATGGFAGAFATKVLVDTADAYSTVQNKIASVVDGSRERVAAEREIYEISQRTRTGYQDTATLFQRLTLSSTALKASQAEIGRVVETVQKSLVTGGANVQEAAGAATQLTQALGAGRLQGDELRSILENAPLLAQAIAREFGVAVGDLKAMGTEGQLTSDRVFRALLKAGDMVEERFAKMKPTVAQSLVVLDNAFTRYIGQADQSLGATAALAQGIISLSENLSDLGTAAVAVAPLLAGVFAARMVNRGVAAVKAPYAAEFARRDAALAQARAAEQMAAERVVSTGGQAAELRSRARTDVDSFADPEQKRNRDRVRKAVEADAAALARAEAEFKTVAQQAGGADLGSVTRSAEQIRDSKELTEQRKALAAAQRDLAKSKVELDRAVGSTEPGGDDRRLRLQEQINKSLSQEDVLRNRLREAEIAEFRAQDAGPKNAQAAREKVTKREAALQALMAQRAKLEDDIQSGAGRSDAEDEEQLSRYTKASAARAAAEKRVSRIESEIAEASKGALSKNDRDNKRVYEAIQKVVKDDKGIAGLAYLRDVYAELPDLSREDTDAAMKRMIAKDNLQWSQLNDPKAQKPLGDKFMMIAGERADLIGRAQGNALYEAPEPTVDQSRVAALRKEQADAGRELSEVQKSYAKATAELEAASSRSTDRQSADMQKLDQQIERSQSRVAAAREALAREEANAGSSGRARPQADRIKVQDQLNKTLAGSLSLQEELRTAEIETADRVVSANGRVEEAKRKVATADRALKTAVSDRLAAERGEANRGLMTQVSDAAMSRRNAAGQLEMSQELLGAANVEVRQNAVANATKALTAAQTEASIAANGYRLAQDGVANASARTGAATTFLATTMRLARTGFASMLDMLGGPIGVAFTALSVGMSIYAVNQMQAAEAAREHAEALEALAKRAKEVTENANRGVILNAVETVKYRLLQKGASEALEDERRTVVRAYQRFQSSSAPRDPSSPVPAAVRGTGVNVPYAYSDAVNGKADLAKTREALGDLVEVLIAAANVDPNFSKDANEASDALIRLLDGYKTVDEARKALAASQAAKPTFDSPLDRDLWMAPKFDGTAAKAAVASFVEQIKGSITELTETRIEFPALATSRDQLADFATTIGQARADAAGLVSQKIVPNDLYDAVAAFTAGKSSVEEYAAQLQELKLANPSFAPLIDSLLASNEKALAARATLAGLGIDISKLDGLVANVLVKIGVSGDTKEIAEAISAEAAKGVKVVADLEAKTRNMRLRADGKTVEAGANEILAQTPTADRDAVVRNLREQEDLQKRISALGRKGKKAPKSEEEKFADRLERLQEEGRAAFFSDTDRALIEEMKKIKGEPALLKSTVDAIKEGKPLPEQAQRLRDALVMKEAGKEYRELVQAYGNADQILPEVAAKQEKLNMLLAAGKITADQYGMAVAESLSKYQNYRWIDQTAESVGAFAGELGEVAFGFKSFDDVANSFIQTIVRLGIQIALVQPLINMLKSGLAAGATGGGGPLSFISSLVGGITGAGGGGGGDFASFDAGAVGSFEWLHEGGIAGAGSSTRTFPLSVLQGAPRFHKGNLGLGPDEIPAILQRGEPVLSRRTARNLSSAIGQLSEMDGGGGITNVNVHPPAGTVPQVQKRKSPTGQSVDVMIQNVIGADLAGNGPLAQAMQDMYGLNRMSGKQK